MAATRRGSSELADSGNPSPTECLQPLGTAGAHTDRRRPRGSPGAKGIAGAHPSPWVLARSPYGCLAGAPEPRRMRDETPPASPQVAPAHAWSGRASAPPPPCLGVPHACGPRAPRAQLHWRVIDEDGGNTDPANWLGSPSRYVSGGLLRAGPRVGAGLCAVGRPPTTAPPVGSRRFSLCS